MEDEITALEVATRAFVTLTGKYDEGHMQGAIPYPVCCVLSDAFLEQVTTLREKWRRLFDLTRPPDNVERLAKGAGA